MVNAGGGGLYEGEAVNRGAADLRKQERSHSVPPQRPGVSPHSPK